MIGISPDTDRHRPESAHKPDDARAGHFAPKWQPKSALYLKYMASENQQTNACSIWFTDGASTQEEPGTMVPTMLRIRWLKSPETCRD